MLALALGLLLLELFIGNAVGGGEICGEICGRVCPALALAEHLEGTGEERQHRTHCTCAMQHGIIVCLRIEAAEVIEALLGGTAAPFVASAEGTYEKCNDDRLVKPARWASFVRYRKALLVCVLSIKT